jgi:hypothetical protein
MNMAGYKRKQFQGRSFEEIKSEFERVYTRVNTFTPMGTEKPCRTTRRHGIILESESSKKQKIGEEVPTADEEETAEELTDERLKQHMIVIIPEALDVHHPIQAKRPIIDLEIHKDTFGKAWKIIRLGGHSEIYKYFEDMLKIFYREDLDNLWSLVKEMFRSTYRIQDKEKELWVELKRLYEPDPKDNLWNFRAHELSTKWRLYDTCGVHHVSTKNGVDVYMLIEKDYPLRAASLFVMLDAKLTVTDEDSVMARELLRKIFRQAKRK